jgi:ATP-dependent DNA helicase RecG
VSREALCEALLPEGQMTRVELMAALGLRSEKHVREHYLQVAVLQGLVAMTIPDKPRSRLQRYCLTPAGPTLAEQSRNKNPA